MALQTLLPDGLSVAIKDASVIVIGVVHKSENAISSKSDKLLAVYWQPSACTYPLSRGRL